MLSHKNFIGTVDRYRPYLTAYVRPVAFVTILLAGFLFLTFHGSTPRTVEAAPPPASLSALFVVGSTTLNAGDAAIKARLESLGLTVTVKDAIAAATADANGKGVVVISQSVASTNVNTKFRDVAVPVVVLEAALYDDMGMTGPTVGTDFDNQTNQTQVRIADFAHPMAANLTGTVSIATAPSAFAWGVPSASAIKVASLAGFSTRYALFGYETDAAMIGMNAPARRAAVFLLDISASAINHRGWALFDAAIRWSANLSPFSMNSSVLFVVGSTTLSAGDAATKTRLENLGLTVSVKDSLSAVTADANGKGLVVISESCPSADINTKFRDVAVPIVVLEPQVFDDMLLTGPTLNVDFGFSTDNLQVQIDNPVHQMAANLTGSVSLAGSAGGYAWGVPGANAIKVASLSNAPGRSLLFGYETGATMVGMTAPARRAGVFIVHATAPSLNTNGWALFDAAIRWCGNWGVNVARSSHGGVASASMSFSLGYLPSGTINGDPKGLNWGFNGGWMDGSGSDFPDWVQVDFQGIRTISEIDVFTVQDTPSSPAQPDEHMTFASYGATNYSVQYWKDNSWWVVPYGSVSGNNKVWRRFTFSNIRTNKIRVSVNDSADHAYSRIVEIEAWQSQANQTPFANIAGPYYGTTGSPISFNGASSVDHDGSIASYQWDFGDNSTGTGALTNHTYSTPGTYNVTLTVTDNAGASASVSTTATVTLGNQSPVANAGGPYLAPKNTVVQLNGTGSSDLDGTISNYQWNFGDGTTGTGVTPTHTYSTANTFTATLTVTDNNGAVAQSSANVVIAEPDPNIVSIKISPDNLTVYPNTPINFSATAYGSNNVPMAGINYVWQTSYLGQDGLVSISQNGQFVAQTPGSYTVSAQGNGHRSQVTVTVIPLPPQCTKNCPEFATGDPEVMWRPGDYPSTRDPQNWRGRPLGGTTEGNGNFQLSIPIMSLEGRGSDMDLQLRYNSRVWNKSGNKISFNMDRDWPAVGWTLGFGKLIHMPESGSFLIEADGTRHSFTGTINRTLSKYTFVGETTDGSFIKYRVTTDRNIHEGYFSSPSATVKYPNGITVYFHSATAVWPNDSFVLYPMEIIDQNGNTISIRYQWGGPVVAQRITTIRDTLGRVLEFHYDSEGLLTAITAAGLKDQNNQTTVSTLVRLHYRYIPIGEGLFSGITEESPEGYIPLIDAVYFPSTGQGYWFGDSDSYSPYMMIRKVVMQRNMGFSTTTNDPILKLKQMGTVTPGTMTLQQVYSYPETPQSLNTGPTFSTLTETWHGMDTSPAVTTYSVTNANPRVTTITRPDNTQVVKYGYNYASLANTNPLKLLDGLVYQEEIKSGGNVLRRTVMEWENGYADAPRVKSTQTTNFENGQTLTTSKQFGYDNGTYNQVTQVREYGLSNELLRKTNTAYVIKNDLDISVYSRNFENYPRQLYLINSVEVRSPSDNLLSLTQYGYDETALENVYGFPNIVQSASFNQNGPIHGVIQHEKDYNPYVSAAFDDTFPYRILTRGNITSITRYTNAATPSGALVDQFRYDITGNVVQSTLAGGRSSKTTFTKDTHNAYPAISITGSLPDPTAQVITSTAYDLNTGLALKTKNVHGQEITHTYYPNSWRAKEIISPTGSRVLFEYDDVALSGTQTARSSLNGPIISKSVRYFNGLGKETRRQELAVLGTGSSGDVWNTVDTQYDKFGRVTRESQSYAPGQIPRFTDTTYDVLGRQLVTADARGSALTFVYNDAARPGGASADAGETVMVRDAWDRWRWSRYNASGLLAEVIEPNPAGGNGFKTLYTYDVLGNLTRIEQGNQVRRFAYDSMGRLLRQKLAEATGTLNSSGAKATTEPEDQRWSSVFTYDDRSNVTTVIDARYVKTTLSYSTGGVPDPLNRLQSVSYDTSLVEAPLVVPGSPTVTYSYRTKTATELKDINQVAQIQVAGVSSEVFDYDSHGRLHEKRITLSGRPSPMTITYDYDNESRLNQITYPEQYPGTSRKAVTHNYDIAGRMNSLKVNNVDYASQIAYNAESQITTFKVGTGANQVTENYTYDDITGLVLTQTVTRGGTTLQSLGYDYHRGICEDPNAACDGSPWVYWTTGQITRVSNGLTGKLLHFNYDELGRLTNTDQGRWIQTSPKFGLWGYKTDWEQDYTYDRYGNRTSVTASNNSGVTPIPQDGLGSISYDQNSNRINSAGFTYDAAGNQLQNGTGKSFTYDAAGRLVKVKDSNGNTLETYTYNASRRRLITQHGNESSTSKTFYVWSGDSVITEYTEPSGATMPKWSKNFIYFGTGLLATQEPNGSGGELVRYHHPDRLGTRLITNNADTSYVTQSHMPFGNSLETNSATNRVFTSYERSGASLVDYALNRNYDSRQGRFTQVDPIGMDAVDLLNPQSLNLYSYVGNDPVNSTDPSGLFGFGFSISGPGHVFPGVGPGSGGGLLGGLANFGLGLLGSIFGGGNGSQRHIIGSPFFSPPPSLPILPLPGPVTSTVTTYFWQGEQPTTETPNQSTGTSDDKVLRSHAVSLTGWGYVKWAHRHITYRAVEGVIIGIESDIMTAVIGYSNQFVGKHTTDASRPLIGRRQGKDDKGHIIGAGLGGGINPINLFWQSRTTNRGLYERFEREIRKTLTEHRDWSAHITVQLFYPKVTHLIFGNGFRPRGGAYYVVYWKDGKPIYTGWPFKFSNF